MKRLGAVLAVVGVLIAVTACEPKMTITAKADHPDYLECETLRVVGKVAPATATPKVVLQRTSGGKWVDVKGQGSQGAAVTVRTASVSKSSGSYSISYVVDWQGTRHLRVRSNGSGASSPGFYLTIEGSDGC